MKRYLFSRFILVYIISYFIDWGLNINNQFYQFFDISFDYKWYLKILSWILTIIILIVGIIFLNFTFFLLRMKSDFFNMNSLEEIKENGGFKAFFLYFYQDFFKILNDNFNFEFNSEKYGSILLIFTFIFFSLIKGSPLLNNYYGIYREYETVSYNSNGDEVYDYTEEGYYIVEKFNRERIDFLMNTLSKKNEFDEESNFRVKKKGFIFAQSALIDGYRANKNYFYGFFSYLHSLIIFGFEKLITVLIYFFLPFTSTIFINNFLNRKNAS